MIKKIKDLKVHYELYGEKHKKTVVLLHGWGQNIEMMKPLGNPLSKDHQVLILDLPGHGESEEPTTVWTLYDFVEVVHQLLEELKIEKPILVGHSFGGKISLFYASMYEVEKLIILAAPFKKEIQKLSLKTKCLKTLKKVPGLKKLENWAKKHMGSTDYRNASPIMRQIMVNHVNLDITDQVKKINAPTLLIWGTMDEAVPLERAYELEQLIPNAGVVEYEGCTHYAYLERLQQTINVIRHFLREE